MKNLLDHDAVWKKHATEDLYLGFTVEGLLTGETISSAACAVVPSVQGELTATATATVSGATVSTRIAGGLVGHEYTVRFTIVTSSQPAIVKDMLIKVIR